MLVHGDTYTSSYWTFPINGFLNYSYVAFSCERGISSFAFDMLGAGLSTHPSNSTDIQLAVAGNITSSLAAMLKDGSVSRALGGPGAAFSKVIATGHSLGSITLNWAAIALGASAPFDAFVSTAQIHDPGRLKTGLDTALEPARNVDPVRWGGLDPGYLTTPNVSVRARFYAPDKSTFSEQILEIDQLTKDLGSSAMAPSVPSIYAPATGYLGPVAVVMGSEDQIHCYNAANGFAYCNVTGVMEQERPFYPDTRNLSVFVIEHTGHDLNLHFSANGTFHLFTELVQSFV
jgi:hypothetical protein